MAGMNFIAEEWSSTTTYQQYDVVQVDGVSYVALQSVPASTQITNTTYWKKLGIVEEVTEREFDVTLSSTVEMVDAKVLLDGEHEVVFASDLTFPTTFDGALATLPEQCCPDSDVYISTYATSGTDLVSAMAVITTEGKVFRVILGTLSGENTTLHMEGKTFSVGL